MELNAWLLTARSRRNRVLAFFTAQYSWITNAQVHQFRIRAEEIGFGDGDVDGRLLGGIVTGAKEPLRLRLVIREQAFPFAGFRIEAEKRVLPFAQPIFLFH